MVKKILSLLVVVLFLFSVPVSAAAKNTGKHKPDTKPNKQVKVDISSDAKTLSVGKEITLTATNNKVGLTVLEQGIQAQTWVVQLDGKTIATDALHNTNYNIVKKAAKNSPTSILKFTPKAEGKYTFIYSIRLGAGKSKVTFYGTKSLTMETTKADQEIKSGYEFKIGSIPSYVEPLHKINVPVTLRSLGDESREYDHIRVNVSYAGPENGLLNLWAKDTHGDLYDVAEIGYWGPKTGFPIDEKYDITTNFTARFSTEGTYLVKLSLVDLEDNSRVITSKTIKVTVGSSADDVESTYIFKIGALPSNILALDNISLPVTLAANQVNTTGYNKVRINVSYTAPEDGILNLWAKDTNGITWDLAKVGYWGPESGFPISKDYNVTTNLTARFSMKGTYTIRLKLVNLEDDSVIASKTLNVNVGSATGSVERLTIKRLAITPSANSSNLYTLSVVDILVTYSNGSTQIKLNPVYVIGDVSFDDLVKTTYTKTFNLTYNGYTQSFTLTGRQILNLL